MGVDDYQRGIRDGYSGVPTAPAASADEAMGRTRGEADRIAEGAHLRAPASGYDSVHLPIRFVPVGLALLVAFLLGVRLSVLLVLAAGLLGLAGTGWVRGILRQLTPVYVGAMLGLCISAVSLMGGDAPLGADNLLILPALGAASGAGFAVVRALVRRSRR